jgi:xylulokinase
MDASMPAAKIRWLREHSPDIHKGTQLFTGCKDYLRHRLTGDRLTDTIDACATSLYSIQARRWSQELISAVGITQDHLPEVHDPTEVAGFLQKEPAYVLGLKAGIPVVVGSGDDIEVLGTGLMGPGCSLEHLGTTGSIMTCSEQPIYDPNMKLELYPHADPDLWVLGGSITAAGSALAWAAETLGYSDLDATLSILSQPLSKLDRTLIFIPHLLGERCPNWNPLVRGAWIGLTNTHTTDDLMYAVFKGVAFALKNILERIEALVGEQKQVTVAQWSNSNSNWLHLRADIYERPLGLLRSREPTALGAMMLAAVGAGLYRNIHEAVEKTTSLERTIESDPRTRATNRRVYTIYQQVVDALVSVWSTL